MRCKRRVFILSCAVLSSWIALKADAPCIRLIRESGTKQISSIDEQLSRPMKWGHGAYFLLDATGGNPPVFYTLDRDGAWTSTAQFRDPEPASFSTFAYDRQTNGNIVFSGQTETAPRVVSPFLAWISADGTTQRMIGTGNYFPYEVAVAPDDSIWTLGFEMVNLDPTDPAVNQEAHVLRHFDKAGNLIGSAFPQSQFSREERHSLATGLLVATRDRLGWYGRQGSGNATYTEFSLDTITVKKFPGVSSSPGEHGRVVAFAMTSSGVASVSIEGATRIGSPWQLAERKTTDSLPCFAAGSAALCASADNKRTRVNYVFDRPSSSWVAVDIPRMGGFDFTPMLIGSDGENLVFKYAREAGFFSVSH